MSVKTLLLLAIVVFGLLARVTPTLTYGEPFSTDVWPLIRLSRALMHGDTRLYSYHGGYDSRWPGVSLAVAVFSVVAGIDVDSSYRFVFTIMANLLVFLFIYAFIVRLLGSRDAGIMALGFYAFTPSILVFSSTALKEVFSMPFFFGIFLLILFPLDLGVLSTMGLFMISIVVSHPLSPLILSEFLLSIGAVYLVRRLVGRATRGEVFNMRLVLMGMALLVVYLLYIWPLGWGIFHGVIGYMDLIVIFLYASFIYGTYYILQAMRGAGRIVIPYLIILVFLIPAFYFTTINPVPGLLVNAWDALPYVVPIILPLALYVSKTVNRGVLSVFIIGSGLALALNLTYIVFANPALYFAFHRIANYIVVAETLIIAGAMIGGKRLRMLGGLFTVAAVLSGLLVLGSITSGNDRLMFYWVYRDGEVSGFNHVSRLAGNIVIAGDAKVTYFLMGVRGVDSTLPIRMLYGLDSGVRTSILILYNDNFMKGYAVGLNIYNITGLMEGNKGMERIYDNGEVRGYYYNGGPK